MRMLHHIQLLLNALTLTSLTLSFHVFLSYLHLKLADRLIVLLHLIFKVHPLLQQLLVLLLEIEFYNARILQVHLFGLYLAHLVEHLVLFARLVGLCLPDTGHQGIVLLSQIDLILLLHS